MVCFRLMDTEALWTYYDMNTPYLRSSAMCSKKRGGAIVLTLVNNGNTAAYNVSLSGTCMYTLTCTYAHTCTHARKHFCSHTFSSFMIISNDF